jgi:ATP-dependent helicase/nuclease subunit A
MTPPIDQPARERFATDFDTNLAVNANAGSGKTTAISRRLATLATLPRGREELPRTVVVTFTRKAAAEIRQRARQVLLAQVRAKGPAAAGALDLLDQAFFGTIHSFCLTLARRHGQTSGTHLAPEVLDEAAEERVWEDFLEEETMTFAQTGAAELAEFLRLVEWNRVLELARRLEAEPARRLLAQPPPGPRPAPDEEAWRHILALSTQNARARKNLELSKTQLAGWRQALFSGQGWVGFPRAEGKAAKIVEWFARHYAPLKRWAAAVGGRLAAELAERFRAHRFRRGLQSYADQVEAAAALLHEPAVLAAIRAEGYRVILDEAQDTDPQQFAVLVEITRPPGACVGDWPGNGPGPRPGHFCMVGDGQQSIYGSRADIRNYRRHLEALQTDPNGALLEFSVSFRVPQAAVPFLNAGFDRAFGRTHPWNVEPANNQLAQVPFQPLAAGPANAAGAVSALTLATITTETKRAKVDTVLADEAELLARRLQELGPTKLGARHWGEVCLLAPRNQWLVIAARAFERAGLPTALHARRVRNREQPAYAWAAGLLKVACDPENSFEWAGVLREVFAVSDAVLAIALAGGQALAWDEPERYADPTMRAALEALRPLVLRVDDEAESPARWWRDLRACARLDARALAADAAGSWRSQLDRIDALARQLTVEGGDVRALGQALLDGLDQTLPATSTHEHAISLVTCHSAKGLEWPVVIPLGWWRPIGRVRPDGLTLIEHAGRQPEVYFDESSLPDDLAEARERERVRELVRLLYVTLTRARRHLIFPRGGAEAVPTRRKDPAFADLWSQDHASTDIERLPEVTAATWPAAETPPATRDTLPAANRRKAPDWDGVRVRLASDPARTLPHRLAHSPDTVRDYLDAVSGDEPRHVFPAFAAPSPLVEVDPLVYGVWWHETMEHLPWHGSAADVETHLAAALAKAEVGGFAPRAREELGRLCTSPMWSELRSAGCRVRTELPVFLPMDGGRAWVDGVVDLVAETPSGEVWLVDWKTNRHLAGESDESLLARLLVEYAPQLRAYREILRPVFAERTIITWLVSTASGRGISCEE